VTTEKDPGHVPMRYFESHEVREGMLVYLNYERKLLDENLERIFRLSLRDLPLGASEIANAPQYWERLVDACTTIGSRALDVIEKRLVIIGHSMRWDSNIDYRTLAHQLYLATEQARKMKNVYMQRRKCVQAVLKAVEVNENRNAGRPMTLRDLYELPPNDFKVWVQQSFRFFEMHTSVNPRFFEMYSIEWERFCTDFISVQNKKTDTERVFRSYYEKFALELEKQLSKGSFSFQTQMFSPKRNDIDLSEDLALNLKLNSGELIMMYEFQKPTSVNIMDLSQEIFLALMNKFHIEFLGVVPINTGNKGIRVELPKPEKTEILKDIQSTVLEIFKNYKN
jgi:hypothetical protein